MSKNLPSKKADAVSKIAQPITPRQNPTPAIREAQPLTLANENSLAVKSQHDLVTVYKDLNFDKNQSLLNQQKHLIIAFVAFILLGMGIFMGSHFSNSRGVASASFKGFEAVGTPTFSEQYHYDKSCYTGENGEQVCMTRTSRK